ncbi:MAG: LL-diaminopimelate aminotransferase [Nitrospinae bacterium]|nr:LL-diaminopimelate aminotransferase [Nitrospinota bacterium]
MFGKDPTIYKFEKIKRARRQVEREYPDAEIIDLGVGEPDEMAFPQVVETLQKEAPKPENRGYADNGIQEFKDAAAGYMKKIYGVDLDPETEVCHSIGSKPALAMLPYAFINPGEILAITVPGYPVMATHTKYLGGRVRNLALTSNRNFLPDLNVIDAEDKPFLKMIYLNYPNNPTGAQATVKFYEEVVEYALKNRCVVVQDAAYAALTYGSKPLSFLSVDGAKEVGVEVHSLSKAFNMTGWRMAFVAGNPLMVKSFATVKDTYDSGQFIPIQKAAITALENPWITGKIVTKYERRLKLLVEVLNKAGFEAKMPAGSFYLYVRAPREVENGPKFLNSEEFAQWLIMFKHISIVPWTETGDFIRFSVTFSAASETEERRVMAEVGRRLCMDRYIF